MSKKYIIPEGTRDLVLGDCNIKDRLKKKIEGVFNSWGYREVVTPTTEFYQTFNSGFSNLQEEDVYKFFDSKGRILVLRPDMTIPIARVVATKFKGTKDAIRLRYTSNVYRMHKGLGGKRNEYTDCGIELIGLKDKQSDLEILVTALDVLKIIGKGKVKLEIGNINFFDSAIKDLNLDKEEEEKLAQLIDKKSLKALEEYLDELSVDDEYKEFFKNIPWLFGDNDVLEKAKKYTFNKKFEESLEYLQTLKDSLRKLGYEELVSFDLGMVPRFNYYTGITFRGFIEGASTAVLSGGRYDNLIKNFGEDRPAVGFSVNLDSVLDAIEDKEIEGQEYYRIYYGDSCGVEAFKESQGLRNINNIVQMIYEEGINEVKIEKVGAKYGD